jgi:hypothetical protein
MLFDDPLSRLLGLTMSGNTDTSNQIEQLWQSIDRKYVSLVLQLGVLAEPWLYAAFSRDCSGHRICYIPAGIPAYGHFVPRPSRGFRGTKTSHNFFFGPHAFRLSLPCVRYDHV